MHAKWFVWSALVAASMTWVPHAPEAADANQLLSNCQGLLTEQWQALSQGDYDTANKTLERARQDGCLQQPVAGQLCAIPVEQEAIHDAKGDVALVNMARNQQRLLGCEM